MSERIIKGEVNTETSDQNLFFKVVRDYVYMYIYIY